jgi:hypothetical protein
VQVLEVDHVAAHNDQVQPLGVLHVEVADGALVEDPKSELEPPAGRRPAQSQRKCEATGAHRQPLNCVGLHHHAVAMHAGCLLCPSVHSRHPSRRTARYRLLTVAPITTSGISLKGAITHVASQAAAR